MTGVLPLSGLRSRRGLHSPTPLGCPASRLPRSERSPAMKANHTMYRHRMASNAEAPASSRQWAFLFSKIVGSCRRGTDGKCKPASSTFAPRAARPSSSRRILPPAAHPLWCASHESIPQQAATRPTEMVCKVGTLTTALISKKASRFNIRIAAQPVNSNVVKILKRTGGWQSEYRQRS